MFYFLVYLTMLYLLLTLYSIMTEVDED